MFFDGPVSGSPNDWVGPLTGLLRLLPWAGGLIAVICVVRFALVPLIEAIRGRREK